MSAHEVRKQIKAQFPQFQFSVKFVSFMDLARGGALFVESKAWTPEIYKALKEMFPRGSGVIVS